MPWTFRLWFARRTLLRAMRTFSTYWSMFLISLPANWKKFDLWQSCYYLQYVALWKKIRNFTCLEPLGCDLLVGHCCELCERSRLTDWCFLSVFLQIERNLNCNGCVLLAMGTVLKNKSKLYLPRRNMWASLDGRRCLLVLLFPRWSCRWRRTWWSRWVGTWIFTVNQTIN